MRASVAFFLLGFAPAANAGELILEGTALYSHAGARWKERAQAETMVMIAPDTLAFVKDQSWFAMPLGDGGASIAPLSLLDGFDRGRDTLIPVYLAHDGTLYMSVVKYDRLPLYELRRSSPPRSLVNKQGAGDYRFFADGSYVYVERPGMGKSESRHFSDMILGETATLYRAGSAVKQALVESAGLNDPRIIDRGSMIVYWRPGRIDENGNKKTWILETLDLDTKTTHTLDEYEDVLMNGKSTSVRFSPHYFSWEDSPWLVFPDKAGEPRVIMLHARTQERHAFSVPAGWYLVPRPGGPVRGPALIVASKGRTIRVVSVPHLKPLLETKAPAGIGRIERGIFVSD